MGEKSLIFTLFFLILVGMCSMFYFKNHKEYLLERENLLADIARIEEELERAKDIDEQIAEAQKRLEEIQQKMLELSKKVQTEIKMPVILNKIEEFAKQTDIEFKEVKFDPINEYESYSVMNIQIQMEGEYHALGRFVARLENFKLLTARKGRLSLMTTGSSGSSTAYANLNSPGYQGIQSLKKKTVINLSFNFEVYKFAKMDYGGAQDVL